MKLSTQQYLCATCADSLAIEACAGSGKTRTMTAKILMELPKIRSTSRDILCITYTNAAVNEIEGRLHSACTAEDADRVHICTIHSFCLNHVVKPHAALLGEWANPNINLAPPDSEWFKSIVSQIAEKHNLAPNLREQFQTISIGIDGKAFGGDRLPPKARSEFLRRIRADKAMIFPLVLYYALKIVRERESIAEKIANKYEWIMVDEFQDTTDIQVELLKRIAKYRSSRFCIVGDKRQSIYGFAGARPELFDHFSLGIGARTDLTISENYRSSELIVNDANKLLSGKDVMAAAGVDKDYPDKPKPVRVNTYVDAICEEFLPDIDRAGIKRGNAAVLGPQWWGLWNIGEALRNRGIKVTGAGARPYKRSEVAHLVEVLVARACKIKIDNRRVLWALYNTLASMEASELPYVYSYDMQLLAVRLEDLATQVLIENKSVLGWLKEFSNQLVNLPFEGAWLDRKLPSYFVEYINGMIDSISRDKNEGLTKDVSILGEYADAGDAIRLMTIHAAKGAEYDAVAIIGCDEKLLPHPSADPDEARRLLYVGMTRAKKLLRLYYRGIEPSRFLKPGELGYLSQ